METWTLSLYILERYIIMDGKHILQFIVEHRLEQYEVPYLDGKDRITISVWLEPDKRSIDYDIYMDNHVEITEFWWEKLPNGDLDITDNKTITRDVAFEERINYGKL